MEKPITENSRCGWMSEGCVCQCILVEGHESMHIWEDFALVADEPAQMTIEEVYGTVTIK